jgi:hypothetical protein
MKEHVISEQEQQELDATRQEIMQEMADQIGAEYEEDAAGNKVAVRISIDSFNDMLELLANSAMQMGMLEALFQEDESCGCGDDGCEDCAQDDCDDECEEEECDCGEDECPECTEDEE